MRRVVVTGLGIASPLGNTVQSAWSAALAGTSGIGAITLFDTKDCPVTFAGEVKGFQPEQYIPAKDVKRFGRFAHFACGAGVDAWRDSGLDSLGDKLDRDRVGVNIGVGMGGLPEIEREHLVLQEKGYRRITPFLIPSIIANMPSGQLSILLNLRGPNLCNVTACASSAHAIGEAAHIIARGDADVMLTGGSECTISPLGIGGFAAMRALSTRNDAPTKASRPYDKDRDGFVMGEGGAGLVLEDYEYAKKRGAKIYAEIIGYGLSGDAYHMTLPAPEGEGGARAMKMALAKAARDHGLRASDIHYVNSHGTSTPAGDAEEARAISKLFPEAKSHLHVSSTKSMTGHLLGGAGAVEAVFSILAIRDGAIPPTINLENPDPACTETGLNFTPNEAVRKRVTAALSNSFGFGGTNACLVFRAL